jgi:hypothetical protein
LEILRSSCALLIEPPVRDQELGIKPHDPKFSGKQDMDRERAIHGLGAACLMADVGLFSQIVRQSGKKEPIKKRSMWCFALIEGA